MPSKKRSTHESLDSPQPICVDHSLSDFECGEPSLNDWLRRRAMRNEAGGASRTYVVCVGRDKRVVAYYCLAAGAIAHSAVGSRVRRNMPDPIPAMVLGRLAVDRRYQGNGLGQALLRDATLRTLQAAKIVGIRVLLVHAISNSVRKYYERHGFQQSPIDPMTLMIPISEANRALGDN